MNRVRRRTSGLTGRAHETRREDSRREEMAAGRGAHRGDHRSHLRPHPAAPHRGARRRRTHGSAIREPSNPSPRTSPSRTVRPCARALARVGHARPRGRVAPAVFRLFRLGDACGRPSDDSDRHGCPPADCVHDRDTHDSLDSAETSVLHRIPGSERPHHASLSSDDLPRRGAPLRTGVRRRRHQRRLVMGRLEPPRQLARRRHMGRPEHDAQLRDLHDRLHVRRRRHHGRLDGRRDSDRSDRKQPEDLALRRRSESGGRKPGHLRRRGARAGRGGMPRPRGRARMARRR